MSEYESEHNLANDVEPEEKKRVSAADIRYAAWFVLVIAAVFVINAMEDGSYRTPWPVAILVSLAGLGLLGYSFLRDSAEREGQD